MTAGPYADPGERTGADAHPPLDRVARARLVSAATSSPVRPGAPAGSGRRPGRAPRGWAALVAGALATAVLVAAVAITGSLRAADRPVLAEGDLVVGRVSAARYLDLGGRLHPVLNVASARLLTTTPPRAVVVDDEVLASLPHGPALGIPGAPDDLPAADRLLPAGWLACADGADAVRLRLAGDAGRSGPASASPSSSPPSSSPPSVSGSLPAVTVVAPGPTPVRYLLVGGRRLALPPASAAALADALAGTGSAPVVPAALLDLFAPGTPLDAASLTLGPGVGAPLPASLRRPGVERAGQLVATAGSAGVVLADGLLPLDPFAAAVYAATAPSDLGRPVPLGPADLASVPLSDHADPAPADWPHDQPVPTTGVPCAVLTSSGGGTTTTLVLEPDLRSGTQRPPGAATTRPAGHTAVDVPAGGGALVRVGADGADGDDDPVLLVDGTGTAFPVAAPVPQTLSRLGYGAVPVASVPAAWAALLPRGPELGTAAARRGPG